MLDMVKWMVLSQVVVLAADAKPIGCDVTFEDCGSLYDIVRLNIGDCVGAPCYMPLEQNVKIVAEFEYLGQPMQYSMRHEVKWTLNQVDTIAETDPNICEGCCVYRTEMGYGFTADVAVSPSLPKVNGTLEWISLNEDDEKVVCFKVPVFFDMPPTESAEMAP